MTTTTTVTWLRATVLIDFGAGESLVDNNEIIIPFSDVKSLRVDEDSHARAPLTSGHGTIIFSLQVLPILKFEDSRMIKNQDLDLGKCDPPKQML